MAQSSLPYQIIDSVKQAQQKISIMCGTDLALDKLRKNPAYKQKEDAMNRMLRSVNVSADTIITLPVVIHIVDDNPYSIPDANIYAGLQLLNDAFSKSGIYSASAGADTKIRFCLAKKDPDGGITNGITRTTSFYSNTLDYNTEDSRLKNLIQWDPVHYINIWLIKSIEDEAYASFSCGSWYRLRMGGYATMPPNNGPLDGIVITGFGRLLAHEMGHYLGLYHTFTGGCNNYDCQLDGDMVCDTPPDGTVMPSFGCANPSNSCNTDTLSNYSNGIFHTDVPDQISNFMDYGNDACSNQFTQGQANRMRGIIVSQRPGLLWNGCDPPCVAAIKAGFTRDVAYSIPGNTIHFTNTSLGASNYQWLVNDTVVATTQNFSYTFNRLSKDKVTLKAFNSADCFASYTDYVLTNCGVTARFFTNKQALASKTGIYEDSILFTNTSYHGLQYQWLISNGSDPEKMVSTSENLNYIFPKAGSYNIRLIATNGTCSDTTNPYPVPVADPTADASAFGGSFTCYGDNKIRVNFCIADYGYASVPAGTPVSFYDADPRLPGAHKLSPTFFLPYAAPGGFCYVCFNHVLNVKYHGIEQLFISVNDSGNVMPVTFSKTFLSESSFVNNITTATSIRTTIYASICDGKNYAGYTKSGTYIDTLASKITGCDSIRTLILTVKPVFKTTVTTSICAGENYAGHTTSGTFVDVYSAVNGCDSTRTLHLTVKPVFKTTISVAICEGQQYYGHNKAGTYTDHYFAENGCDSTRTVYLTVKPISRTIIYDTICQGQNYAGHTVSGTFVDRYFGINSCDSIRTLHLIVKPVITSNITASICQGQNYAGHTSSGTYIDVYTASNGCDSTRVLSLTVNPLQFTSVTAAICFGQNYAGHTTSGTYIDVYPSITGCDSTRTLFLTVKPVRDSTIHAVICDGDKYEGYSITGIYTDVFTAANGCDSTRTLFLTVKPRSFTVINADICKGENYYAAGSYQTISGTFYDTLTNYLGCDSIITTHLVVHDLPHPDLGEDRFICEKDSITFNPGIFTSYLWQDGSTAATYTTSKPGHYSVQVKNNFGCIASDEVTLPGIAKLPRNFLPPDSSLCRGNTVRLLVPGYVSYLWSTGENMGYIDVVLSGVYRLTVTDKNGCHGIDSVKIVFYDCKDVWIPNAFTPDDNGRNDLFRPVFPAPVTKFHFTIWNRYGNRVFESYDQKAGWDGKLKGMPQTTDVYVYVLTFTDIDGKEKTKKGIVTLLR